MVGRRLREGEDALDGGQHVLSTDVLHESGESFAKGVTKDEGLALHYLRHIYLVVGTIAGVFLFIKAYQASFAVQPLYEDYLDWVVYQHVKRGRPVEQLARIFYQTDRYSVEGRSS